MHVLLGPSYTNIKDKIADRIVTAAVNKDYPSAGSKHPKHLRNGTVLMRIMMKRITASHHVKRIILEL